MSEWTKFCESMRKVNKELDRLEKQLKAAGKETIEYLKDAKPLEFWLH